MSSISPSSSASNGSFVCVEGVEPPCFPGVAAVDSQVALKYLEVYQAYLVLLQGGSSVVSVKSRSRPGKRRRGAKRAADGKTSRVSSSVVGASTSMLLQGVGAAAVDVEPGPSDSVSQVGLPGPSGIVRVSSSTVSLNSYTAPGSLAAVPGLVLRDRGRGDGYCYSAMLVPHKVDRICAELGPEPAFKSLLALARDDCLDDVALGRLQVVRVGDGRYHVVTGTVMPSLLRTLVVVAAKVVDPSPGSLAGVLSSRVPDMTLVAKSPALEHVLGASVVTYFDSRYGAYIREVVPDPARIEVVPRAGQGASVSYAVVRGSQGLVAERVGRAAPAPANLGDYVRSQGGVATFEMSRGAWEAVPASPQVRSSRGGRRRRESASASSGSRGGAASSAVVGSAASTVSVRVAGSLQGVSCTVCIETVEEGGGILSCGHVFHAQCVEKWMEQSGGRCPTCRAVHRRA